MYLRYLLYLSLLFPCIISANFSFESPEILDAEQAFVFTGLVDDKKIMVTWNIAPGYYIYKESISIQSDNQLIPFNFINKDESELYDEFFGDSVVLLNLITIESAESLDNFNNGMITVSYQGCAEGLYCYPKIKKIL